MEILNPRSLSEGIAIKTLEQSLMKTKKHISLRIGLPKEISNEERRICLTPAGVSVLIANGHKVYVEKNAGIDSNFPDHEYSDVGAEICYSAEQLYKNSELVIKVAAPQESELEYLQQEQIVFSALHLGNVHADLLRTFAKKCITGIGFEFIQTPDRVYPIVRMMHEITGSIAIQIGAHYLESAQGQGILLGGISGVPPSTVVIVGAGIIGEYAARTALGYGAQVFVLDNDLSALRRLENALDRRIHTAMANFQYLVSSLPHADLVIGAAMG